MFNLPHKGATFINPYQGLKRVYLNAVEPSKGNGATFINPYQGLKPSKTGKSALIYGGATFINPYQGLKPVRAASKAKRHRVQLLLIPIRD